jgi:hypothetical protein
MMKTDSTEKVFSVEKEALHVPPVSLWVHLFSVQPKLVLIVGWDDEDEEFSD